MPENMQKSNVFPLYNFKFSQILNKQYFLILKKKK